MKLCSTVTGATILTCSKGPISKSQFDYFYLIYQSKYIKKIITAYEIIIEENPMI